MTWQSFNEILASNKYDKDSLQKLCFRMDATGPQYKINFGEKYFDPREAVENDDFTLEIKTPINKTITDKKMKKNILAKLIHHTNKSPSSLTTY